MDNLKIRESKEIIKNANVIIIGAGAGLSTAAGVEYSGKRFTDNFPDYIEKYNLTDMYSSVFYPFETAEEKWGYLSRHIKMNGYGDDGIELYSELLKIVKDKNYFVMTTNGDGLFFKSGFEEKRIFAPQGDYTKFQCETPCHDKLYDNKTMVEKMVKEQKDCRIPTELIPRCPRCGGNLVPHLRIDSTFVENQDWQDGAKRYVDFVKEHNESNMVLLELGVGFNTPSIIRWPFEKFSISNRNSRLIRVNKDNVQPYHQIPDHSILIEGDIKSYIMDWK